ncbi:isoprenylcysteine carboxylmethyltransferase family protein [Microbacterium sp. Kw_RZR3]|jgi:protein-S-isoprenylcysteine O-methyltransferase Ste14|uniref:methyltransferase family protein n=1 Tax=Microbacterium sp. Kw_RZR3 TaxID=3032903 RepID=UPI0023DA63AA|nr:isoprenylcysteine carboxylmethyltransferase family protein [Microbacterium sp. Kw_RZR3]MDF2047050.1 isoprenylcysteine carboxylmethyltransferase family protein [Microbacterium sp. Kw_RZR3]
MHITASHSVPIGRLYFAAQALAGAAWWVCVFAVPLVRTATLGDLDPALVAMLDVPLFVVASALAVLPGRAGRIVALVATAWTLLVTAALAVYATVTGLAGWGVVAMVAAATCSVLALALLWLGRVPTNWLLIGPFAFRRARPRRTPIAHVVATTAQIVVFWGLFLVVFPLAIQLLEKRWGLAAPVPAWVTLIGAGVALAASALGLASAAAITVKGDGTPLPSAMPNRLVIAGPYRWVRNPMALAGIAQGVGVGLILQSWLVVVYALAGSLVWNYAIRPHEEADLEASFGDDYRRYRDEVRCWVPGRRRNTTEAPLPPA